MDAHDGGERMNGHIRQIGDLVRQFVAPNPGPMTLDGTNSYVIGAPASDRAVVVDPGPLDEGHLSALAASGTVELILITHRHADHVDGAARLAEMTSAPVRAMDAAFCIGADPLADGERVTATGTSIEVVATPGHTADSVCLLLPDAIISGAMLTGDTILGRGTTILAEPDGSLGDYLSSLRRLRGYGPAAVLPGHGPVLPDLAAVCDGYIAHRERRLDEVRAALDELGADASVEQVTDRVYAQVDPAIRFAAESSVRAQLAHLRR